MGFNEAMGGRAYGGITGFGVGEWGAGSWGPKGGNKGGLGQLWG